MTDIKELYPQPKGINFANFSVCDTHGGTTFREGCSLMKHKGIFVGFRNGEWSIIVSSDPNAKWRRGVQDAWYRGSSLPRSDKAHFVGYDRLPPEGQELVRKWVGEAIEIVKTKVAAWQQKQREEWRKEHEAAEAKHLKEIVEPWLQAAKQEDKEVA